MNANPKLFDGKVFGVGFLTADRMAHQLGIPADAPERLEAGVLHTLNEASVQGHVFLPEDQLLSAAATLLEADPESLPSALAGLVARQLVIVHPRADEPAAIYIPRLERAEATVALDLTELVGTPPQGKPIIISTAVAWYQGQARIELAARQREALAASLTEKAVVITGGPGTGKTTLIRGVVQILGRKDLEVVLAAPTGRAAKRLSEATGRPASTNGRVRIFMAMFKLKI